MGRKEIGDGVEIDHRHAQLPSNPRAIAARSGGGQRLPRRPANARHLLSR